MEYYTFYVTNNCQHSKVFKRRKLSTVLAYLRANSTDNNFMIFDRDTWNTSEPNGLVAFGTGCEYWVNTAKTVPAIADKKI